MPPALAYTVDGVLIRTYLVERHRLSGTDLASSPARFRSSTTSSPPDDTRRRTGTVPKSLSARERRSSLRSLSTRSARSLSWTKTLSVPSRVSEARSTVSVGPTTEDRCPHNWRTSVGGGHVDGHGELSAVEHVLPAIQRGPGLLKDPSADVDDETATFCEWNCL